MAKGIGINGQFRGRIGGTVYSRVNGEQVSRAYNPKVGNPRTPRQLWQRAIMSTVMKAYAQGKEIFDHSFEGYKYGSGNQHRFVSLNSRKLRALAAKDVNSRAALLDSQARLCAPGVNVPVPNSWIISEGSLMQNFFTIKPAYDKVEEGVTTHIPAKISIPAADFVTETVAQYCSRLGLVPGEIYTIVGISNRDDEDINYVYAYNEDEPTACIYESHFGFVRLTVKNDVLTDNRGINDVDMNDIFDIECSSNVTDRINAWVTNTQENLQDVLTIGGFKPVYVGIIRSDEDSKLRSNAELIYAGTDASDNMGYGLAYPFVVDAWKTGSVNLGASTKILEGGSF